MQGKKTKPLEAKNEPTLDFENVSPICKDAFNKVMAINSVDSLVDFMGNELGATVRPGIFSNAEIKDMLVVYNTFARNMKEIIGEKFKDAGSVLDDCMKRGIKKIPMQAKDMFK